MSIKTAIRAGRQQMGKEYELRVAGENSARCVGINLASLNAQKRGVRSNEDRVGILTRG